MNLEVKIIKLQAVLKIFKNEVPREGLAGSGGGAPAPLSPSGGASLAFIMMKWKQGSPNSQEKTLQLNHKIELLYTTVFNIFHR